MASTFQRDLKKLRLVHVGAFIALPVCPQFLGLSSLRAMSWFFSTKLSEVFYLDGSSQSSATPSSLDTDGKGYRASFDRATQTTAWYSTGSVLQAARLSVRYPHRTRIAARRVGASSHAERAFRCGSSRAVGTLAVALRWFWRVVLGLGSVSSHPMTAQSAVRRRTKTFEGRPI